MRIVQVAAELAPLAKVGGLADVVTGLSRELCMKKHELAVILPKYDCIHTKEIQGLHVVDKNFPSYYEGAYYQNIIWKGQVQDLEVYFLEPLHPLYFFNRGCIYGCDDDIERYLYFSRAAVDFIYGSDLRPDIIHTHDWQTAAVAPLVKEIFEKQGLGSKVVFSIHNMEYQGKCASEKLKRIGFDDSFDKVSELLKDLLIPPHINLLKGGVVYADHVTTVSPTYAEEVLYPEGGRGLEKTLREVKQQFSGILNGLDYSYWNPETDPYLPARFSSREIPMDDTDRNTIDNKAYVKRILKEKLYLSEQHRPIVGCIARLVPQKGVDMIKHAISYTVEKGGQFVLLGSSPISHINDEFHALKRRYADHPHIHLNLLHNEELAHLIFAGSDMFIVPSIFEPCGLTQLISLKYGTIPIVRRTGGLADTIFDIDYAEQPIEKRNGYTFDFPDNAGLESALGRALESWFHEPGKWRELMVRGMEMDFSWKRPAEAYLDIYKKIRSTKARKSF